MDEPTDLDLALCALRSVGTRWHAALDDELLADGDAWEAVGRLVDARRTAFAAEVEARSNRRLGGAGLARRHGQRDGANLVAQVARVGLREARRRVELGTAIAPRWSLTGEQLPGRLPVLGDAVRRGDVGMDAAHRIAEMLASVRRRATPEHLEQAEVALTGVATEADAEIIKVHIAVRKQRIDPDGPVPDEDAQRRKRLLRIASADEHGGSRFSGYLPAEDRAVLTALLADRRRRVAMEKLEVGHEDVDGLGARWRELEGEQRRAGQFDYDTLIGTITSGIRAVAEGFTGFATSIPEVVVLTTVDDLGGRSGRGWMSGVLAPISVETIERISCGSDIRIQVNGESGEVLHHGRARRRFSRAQRRALVTTAGGCQWPGCSAPPSWCDVHHAAWFCRDGGSTDIENGVLLCSFHHHLIHDPTCRWRIVIHRGQPYLIPRGWHGDPEPGHRMQRHISAVLSPPTDDLWGRPRRQ